MGYNDFNDSELSDSFEYDMRPPASILNVFSRLNYKPHYAIAEFVDNSTQSYWSHREELELSDPLYEMIVDVKYDSKRKTLTIWDNAYGMEKDRFLDAITLDAKNPEQINSRNEFGMGLKTAASWFGNVWSVTSTALGSDKRYTATVNIPELQRTGLNDIEVKITPAFPEDHGTIITISEVTKGMAARSIGKTKALLASMYRRDLRDGHVHLYLNDSSIEFSDYEVLSFRGQEWKKPLDFDVVFGGKNYHVSGFVGILGKDSGGFGKAGFALFRRNRVIIGGEEQNYKPTEIFGQAQSTVSHKLFGELDVDDFPVNQAKDGFIWNDGLEDEFINILKSNIKEYIEIARLTIKQRAAEEQFSSSASDRIKSTVEAALDSVDFENDALDEHEDAVYCEDFDSSDSEDLQSKFLREVEEENSAPDISVGSTRTYVVPISRIDKRVINVGWRIGSKDEWISVNRGDGFLDVLINVNHPFFKPYSNEEEFQVVLEKFVIALVVAEEMACMMRDSDGLIPQNAIRRYMNKLLSKLGD